ALSDAAPPVFTESGSLPAEPLYIDVSPDAPWDPRAAAFRDKVTSLAAPIHGKPKSQLASDDLREQRRFRRLRAAAITGLALLTVIAVVAAVFAFVQRQEATRQRQEAIKQQQEAVRQRDQAIALKLTTQGQAMLAGVQAGGDVRAIQQILAAPAVAPTTDIGPLLTAVVARQSTIKIILSPQPNLLFNVAFSPDGRRIVSGSGDDTVRIWDADTHRQVGAPLTGHTRAVVSVAFSPDGRRIVSGSLDDTVRIWDADTHRQVGAPLTGHTRAVVSVAFSPDG